MGTILIGHGLAIGLPATVPITEGRWAGMLLTLAGSRQTQPAQTSLRVHPPSVSAVGPGWRKRVLHSVRVGASLAVGPGTKLALAARELGADAAGFVRPSGRVRETLSFRLASGDEATIDARTVPVREWVDASVHLRWGPRGLAPSVQRLPFMMAPVGRLRGNGPETRPHRLEVDLTPGGFVATFLWHLGGYAAALGAAGLPPEWAARQAAVPPRELVALPVTVDLGGGREATLAASSVLWERPRWRRGGLRAGLCAHPAGEPRLGAYLGRRRGPGEACLVAERLISPVAWKGAAYVDLLQAKNLEAIQAAGLGDALPALRALAQPVPYCPEPAPPEWVQARGYWEPVRYREPLFALPLVLRAEGGWVRVRQGFGSVPTDCCLVFLLEALRPGEAPRTLYEGREGLWEALRASGADVRELGRRIVAASVAA